MNPLDPQIIAAIQSESFPEEKFHSLAQEIFAHQYAHNLPYRRYCDSLGKTPGQIARWQDIPAVPQVAFKEFALATFPVDKAVKIFHTSGTTTQTPGKHYLDTLELYEISCLEGYHRTFAQMAPGNFAILAPPAQMAPHSSLSHMLDTWAAQFASRGAFFFWDANGLMTGPFVDAMKMAADFREPVFVMGTAFAFVHLIDALTQRGEPLTLPPGSLVMETGGYKGKSRELAKPALYEAITNALGVPDDRIWNEYGMTELGAQFYARGAEGAHHAPPWARVQIVSPGTGEEVPVGGMGLVRVCDLTNRGSVFAIQTEDAAVRLEAGFKLLGRVTLRGAGLVPSPADDFIAKGGRA
ncbi:hypothetical protein QQ056_19735 [Oscillatoria laete-virens NRMC-F 0139]|nr:hypothetical protein [Oscillatoria laete-virens]MDL5055763.1 hypothetical protein [Oscillatoria laete-virens NRMC-F 0139]